MIQATSWEDRVFAHQVKFIRKITYNFWRGTFNSITVYILYYISKTLKCLHAPFST